MTLGERLRLLRKGRGYTQQELADRLGISASAVGMYEQGRRQPDPDILCRVAEVFGVRVDYLVGREELSAGEPAPPEDQDLSQLIDEIRARLLRSSGLMFNGRPLTPQELQAIADAMEWSMKVLALDQTVSVKDAAAPESGEKEGRP